MRYSNILVALPCILMMLSPLALGSPIPYSDDDDDHNSGLMKRSPPPVPYDGEQVSQFDKRSPHGDYDHDDGFPGLQKRSPVPLVDDDDDDDDASLMRRSLPDGDDEDLPVLMKRFARVLLDDDTMQDESPNGDALDTDVEPRGNGRRNKKVKNVSTRAYLNGLVASGAKRVVHRAKVNQNTANRKKLAKEENDAAYKEEIKRIEAESVRNHGTHSQREKQYAKDRGRKRGGNTTKGNRGGKESDSDEEYSESGSESDGLLS